MTTAPRPLYHAELEAIRRRRGRSMLLCVSERGPVEYALDPAEPQANGPAIVDFDLFEAIVGWMCDAPELVVIGIAGGEPFGERRGLALATERLAAAGKRIALATSGVWAAAATPAPWIAETLARCSSVYLGADALDAMTTRDDLFVRAARASASAGAWLIVQVVDHAASLARSAGLLRLAFGERWHELAELDVVAPTAVRAPGGAFGPCSRARAPMIRYDGVVTGCTNAGVRAGEGPARLRRVVDDKEGLAAAVQALRDDPLLRAVGGAGLGALTMHPRLVDLAEARFTGDCQMCWKIHERMPPSDGPDPLLDVLGLLQDEP